MENEWLKKAAMRSVYEKKQMIDPMDEKFTIQEQCALIDLPRSSFYDSNAGINNKDLELKRKMDENFWEDPTQGMFNNPFSFEGRIRRLEYGLSHLIGVFAFKLIAFIIIAVSGAEGNVVVTGILVISFIVYLWFIWAQGAKRCHDIGNSGWWQLIPFYGLWMVFQDGQPGPNQYGENPKGIQ